MEVKIESYHNQGQTVFSMCVINLRAINQAQYQLLPGSLDVERVIQF